MSACLTLLRQAQRALETKGATAALPHLEEAWRLKPVLAVRELSVRLSPVAPMGRKPAEVAEAAERFLLEPPGPRMSFALEQVVTEVPFTSDSSKPHWANVFRAVRHTKDPRFVDLAATLPSQWRIRPLMQKWLKGRLGEAAKDLEPLGRPELTQEEAAVVSALNAAGATAPSQAGPRNEGELLAAVYAHPDDDAARLVYADALMERDDPRGEFIRLQLEPSPSPATLKRAKALLKQHLTEWLGPLAPYVTKSEAQFTRGFLSRAVAKFKNEQEATKYGALPEWATVERLGHSASSYSPTQNKWQHFVGPNMKALREVEYLPSASIELLTSATTPWRLEKATFYRIDQDDYVALATCAQLPNLHELTFHDFDPAWLSVAPWPKHWVTLNTNNPSELLPKWLAAFDATPLQRLGVGVPDDGELRFERGGDGRLSKLTLAGDAYLAQVTHTLSKLEPKCLTSVTVEFERPLNNEVIDRLKVLSA